MITQTENKSAILYGKKSIGFPIVFGDLDHLATLLVNDKQSLLARFSLNKMTIDQAKEYIHGLLLSGQIICWCFTTKEGRKSRKIGYAWLADMTEFTATVVGILDKQFARGLATNIKKDKYTYTEDAFRAMIKYGFDNLGIIRYQSETLESNSASLHLQRKVGFKKEGVMRKAFKIEDQYHNLVILGLLKEEYDHVIG